MNKAYFRVVQDEYENTFIILPKLNYKFLLVFKNAKGVQYLNTYLKPQYIMFYFSKHHQSVGDTFKLGDLDKNHTRKKIYHWYPSNTKFLQTIPYEKGEVDKRLYIY